MYSVLFGGLAYTLQTHVNSIGRDDKESFLEERLSVTEIGKAAFQRAGWFSLFPAARLQVYSLRRASGFLDRSRGSRSCALNGREGRAQSSIYNHPCSVKAFWLEGGRPAL